MNAQQSHSEQQEPLPMPLIYSTYSQSQKDQIHAYLSQFNETEKKAYRIAVDHLGTSYNVLKSNGFQAWLKNQA